MHALLEGGAEGAVAVVAALLGQLLGDDGLMCSGKLAVAGYEVTDAKVGVVVAQPPPVLSHGHHHIYNEGHCEYLPIDQVRGREVDGWHGCLQHCEHRAGHQVL